MIFSFARSHIHTIFVPLTPKAHEFTFKFSRLISYAPFLHEKVSVISLVL
jgi:hypothetical protein